MELKSHQCSEGKGGSGVGYSSSLQQQEPKANMGLRGRQNGSKAVCILQEDHPK